MINDVRLVMEQLEEQLITQVEIDDGHLEFYNYDDRVNNSLALEHLLDEVALCTPHIMPSGSFEQVN
ncbi:unnamed protein product [Leptosia nina]|uniref:Uncharacterized protein n=1 Tax=Leptosia nina TaxID=320188 RepID=A0AAV1JNX4_9NEOP